MKNKNQSRSLLAVKNLATTESLLKIIGGALLVYAGASISIPLEPVPITLQTVAILLIALTYGRAESMAAILTYVGAGVMGAPVFAGGAFGPMVLLSPSGGYIFGFVAAVYIVGYMKEKFGTEKFLPLLAASAMGEVAIFALGVAWLTYLLGFEKAVAVGLMPFILPGVAKTVFLAVALRAMGLLGFLKTGFLKK